MNFRASYFLVGLSFLALGFTVASAHPSSGIVVDQRGHVFFSDLDRGILEIDAQGKVTPVVATAGGHWLALDASGHAAYAIDLAKDTEGPADDLKTFDRKIPFAITPKGGKPESGQLTARTSIGP